MSGLSRLLCALALLVPSAATAQDVTFTSSNLPIVLIDTDGQEIPDEPKIMAQMRVIDNGPGERNAVTDLVSDYEGWIGIETRGASSQGFPKKQYAVETREADGENRNVSLLGLPEENDWVLHAPYSDKTLMRNVLAYGLARATGRYASRTRYCEVVLNGEYQGVYVLMESIKRDGDRVDVSRLRPDETEGDDLTGGYIIKVDRWARGEVDGWTSPFVEPYPPDQVLRYEYHEPGALEIAPEQAAYIEQFVTDFEAAMLSDGFADPETGYPAVLDVGSFVDYFLVTELAKNVDGYRLSTYLHKDKDSVDPRLHAGPVWDFNIAFGNAYYYGGTGASGLQADLDVPDRFPVPFWWNRLAHSGPFETAAAARWADLRRGPFHADSLVARIDSTTTLLEEAQARNFERWPTLGEWVWPNPAGYEARRTHAAEVAFLEGWLLGRLTWLDGYFGAVVADEDGPDAAGFALSPPAPNPARTSARLTLALGRAQDVTVEVFDVRGRRVAQLHDGPLGTGARRFTFDATALPAGVYLVRARGAAAVASQRVVVLGR
jgi:hypothetical protein